jgi:hypothetical protein
MVNVGKYMIIGENVSKISKILSSCYKIVASIINETSLGIEVK